MTPPIRSLPSSGAPVLSSRIDIHAAVEEWLGSVSTPAPPADLSAAPLGLRAWAKQFADEGTSILEMRRNGALEALLPIASRRPRFGGMSLRHWSSPGNFYWQFGYPLLGAAPERTLAAALQLLRARRDWDVLELGPMLAASDHARALRSLGTELGLHPQESGRKHDPVVMVNGAWDDYYARRSGNLREMVRRGERRLTREGRLSCVEYSGGADLEQRLAEFFDLEAAGWKGREGTAIASDPQVRAFYVDLAHEAAGLGQFRLYELRVDERLVAGDYCVVCGNVIHMLKIAYDETRARCSPGQVLRKFVLQRLFEQGGGVIYDLMAGGGEHGAYKLGWANDGREYIVLRLFNPRTLRGRLARVLGTARSLVRRARPS